MTVFEGLMLGIVQGLTEFLPVSSTGHLIIVRELFGIEGGGLVFDAALHLATLAAVAFYFRKDILELATSVWRFLTCKPLNEQDRVFLGAVAWGTVPAVVLGLALSGIIETSARNLLVVAGGLIIGSVVMWYAEYRRAHRADEPAPLTVRRGFRIGLFQALALMPGMSRSGSTIAGGLFNNLSREQATRFAFVLSFPILLGAGSISLLSLLRNSHEPVAQGALAAGLVAALVSGLGAIHFLVRYLRTHTLSVFIWYRLVLAAGIIVMTLS